MEKRVKKPTYGKGNKPPNMIRNRTRGEVVSIYNRLMKAKYERIADELCSELIRIRSKGENKLPSEADLCVRFSCSRQTVRKALEALRRKDLIVKRRGSGTYISDASRQVPDKVLFITEDEDRRCCRDLIPLLKESLRTSGFKLTVKSTGGTLEGKIAAIEEAFKISPAAVLIEPCSDLIPSPAAQKVCELEKTGVRIVSLFAPYRPEIPHVVAAGDNAPGASLLVRRSKDRGGSNMGGLFRGDSTLGLSLYSDVMNSITDSGLTFNERSFLTYTERDTSLLKAFAKRITGHCDTVICDDDLIAHDLLSILPRDIKVAAFGNGRFAFGEDRNMLVVRRNNNDVVGAITDAVTGRPQRAVRWT